MIDKSKTTPDIESTIPKDWYLYDCNSSPHHGCIVGLILWDRHPVKKEDGWQEPKMVRGEAPTFLEALKIAVEKINVGI